MNLAVTVTEGLSHPILKDWMDSVGSCASLWLGYSKEDWYYVSDYKTAHRDGLKGI